MVAVERLPVLRHSADISFPLAALGPLWYIRKWRSAQVYARGRKQCCKRVLLMKSPNKTETPIFQL